MARNSHFFIWQKRRTKLTHFDFFQKKTYNKKESKKRMCQFSPSL